MATRQQPLLGRVVEDVQDAPVGADEDRTGGGVAGQCLAAGEVVAVLQQSENDGEFTLVLGVLIEVGGDGGADVVSCDGHGDHLLK
jgi:hypothetical protein